MTEFAFSVPETDIGELLGAERPSSGAPAAARTILGRWRNAQGEALPGTFMLSSTRSEPLEFADGNGEFASSRAPAGLSFSADLPSDAVLLDIVSGASVAQIPVARLASRAPKLPKPISNRVGEADASFVMPVFSERFTDRLKFLRAVQQLHAWILEQPPFDEDGVGSRLAFDAHFWPSDPDRGLFNTLDSSNPDERLFYGDRSLARQLLAPWMGAGASLILIDSPLRGGAGGQPGYSAWTSIAEKPGERWEAVCLHEVGHGLGLADEYLDEERKSEWPDEFEPNVSRDPTPSKAPWAGLVNVADLPAPTAPLNVSAAVGAVGTFQGARYRADLYRSSQACLMKKTSDPFCAACRAHIVEVLGASA